MVIRSVTKVNPSLIGNSKIEFIGTCTIGTDHVDEEYLKKSGITFKSAPGCNAQAVAEYVITNLLLYATNKNISLKNKTIGIIGVGNVGSIVASYATKLGMQTKLCDPPLQRKNPQNPWSNLQNTLQSDFITFHVPLNMQGEDRTFHLLNEDTISFIPEQAVLINSCRGEIVKTETLIKAMLAKKRGTTILDVWENEPNISHELLQKTTLASPHVAGYTYDAKIRGAVMIAHELQKHFQMTPQNFDAVGQENAPPISISIDEQDSHEKIILSCCLAFFDPKIDDIALKSAPSDKPLGQLFDNLRKNYRKRREFQTIPVKFIGDKPELHTIQVLKELRFQILE